jgi:hypothetical protein
LLWILNGELGPHSVAFGWVTVLNNLDEQASTPGDARLLLPSGDVLYLLTTFCIQVVALDHFLIPLITDKYNNK